MSIWRRIPSWGTWCRSRNFSPRKWRCGEICRRTARSCPARMPCSRWRGARPSLNISAPAFRTCTARCGRSGTTSACCPSCRLSSRTPPYMWSASTARCRRWSSTCSRWAAKRAGAAPNSTCCRSTTAFPICTRPASSTSASARTTSCWTTRAARFGGTSSSPRCTPRRASSWPQATPLRSSTSREDGAGSGPMSTPSPQ